MLGGNPEFVPRKAEVSSEESRSLHRVSFDKLRNRHFGRFRDRLGGGNNSLFLPLELCSLLLPEGRKNGLQDRTLLGLAKRQSRARQAQGPCA
jgi:hypothetical protein